MDRGAEHFFEMSSSRYRHEDLFSQNFRNESSNRSEDAAHRKGDFHGDARCAAQIACFGPI